MKICQNHLKNFADTLTRAMPNGEINPKAPNERAQKFPNRKKFHQLRQAASGQIQHFFRSLKMQKKIFIFWLPWILSSSLGSVVFTWTSSFGKGDEFGVLGFGCNFGQEGRKKPRNTLTEVFFFATLSNKQLPHHKLIIDVFRQSQ